MGYWCNLLQGRGDQTCFYSTGEAKTMESKAYQAYLHQREATIVPMQDGSKLAAVEEVRTTVDLQSHPVDLHVMPNCGAECQAAGRYLNDDGLVLDTTANQNVYQLTYSHTNATAQEVPALLTLTVTRQENGKATNIDKELVNQNDVLAAVYISNAKALNLD